MNLILPLKKKWFDDIKAGTKTVEYRLATPYWRKRLEGKTFDNIVLTLGYPKKDDQEKRITRPWRGYEEIHNFIHEEWEYTPQDIFAIRLV